MTSPDLAPPDMCAVCCETIAEDSFYRDHNGDRHDVHIGPCAHKAGLPRLHPLAAPTKLAFAGDWHANTRYSVYAVEYAASHGVSHILHTGDFGWLFEPRFLGPLEKALAEHDIHLMFVDGNHECVDMATRAVTRRGLISGDQIQIGDEVLSVDDVGNRIWQPVLDVIRKKVSSSMFSVRSRSIDMRMSPGHRFVALPHGSDNWKEYLASDLGGRRYRVVASATNNASDDPTFSDDDLRLLAWCVTDSYRNSRGYWTFYQKESGASRVRDLLGRMRITFSESVRHREGGIIVGREVRSSEPEVSIRIGAAQSRDVRWEPDRLPERILDLSKRQVHVLLDELVYCDGSWVSSRVSGGPRTGVLYSLPPRVEESLQILLVSNGFRTTLTENTPGDRRLYFCERTTVNLDLRGKEYSSKVEYSEEPVESEDVWCVRVPNGRFFAERAGKIALTGNCFAFLDALEDPQITPHIRHIRRGERWVWEGVTFLGLGGAHSVDRPARRPGVEWWPQETIGFQDVERALEGGPVDVMLTHDCPTGVRIPGIEGNPYGFHPVEIALSDEHRDLLRGVVDELRPGLLVHGHYHACYSDVLEGDGYRTSVRGLSLDGGRLVDNMLITTVADIATLCHAMRGART